MSDSKFSVSKEELIRSVEDEGGFSSSFFDNTIHETEAHDESKESKESKEDKSASGDEVKSAIDMMKPANKSFMEMEVKRDKLRWLYMSELGAIFGEEKHTRDSFMKLFCTRVSEINIIINIIQ
jgi:hypothetical protein